MAARLKWSTPDSNGSTITGYVYRKNGGTPTAVVNPVSATVNGLPGWTWADTSGAEGDTYEVAATYSGGYGSWSNAQVYHQGTPAVPTLTEGAKTPTSVVLSWNASAGAISYDLDWVPVSIAVPSLTVGTITPTSVALSWAAISGAVDYEIAWTPVSLLTPTLTATTVTSSSVMLNWSPVDNAVNYDIAWTPVTTGTSADPANWFISSAVTTSGDGKSWATAWKDLSDIVWSSVSAGQTIAIDGGPTRETVPYGYVWQNDTHHAANRPGLTAGLMYTATPTFSKDGQAGSPITLRLSTESGRNGTAVIFCGRETALPYASQSSYSPVGTGRTLGLDVRNRSYLTIDGMHRSGIMIYGAGQTGIQTGGGQNLTLRNLEIFDCGNYGLPAQLPGPGGNTVTGYKSDGEGLQLGTGTTTTPNLTIDRVLVHDCGQDPAQAPGSIPGVIVTNSWFYNARTHPTWAGFPFSSGAEAVPSQNATHVDGIQVYSGLRAHPLLFQYCIFGPFITKGIYPGDSTTQTSPGASNDDVSISDVLFLYCIAKSFQGDAVSGDPVSPARWLIDHVTSIQGSAMADGYTSSWAMADMAGTGHSLTNSIKVNANFGGASTFTGTNSGNYYESGSASVPGGTAVALGITQGITSNKPTWSDILAVDTTPTNATVLAAGAGSRIRKIADLLARIDTLNGS